MNEKKYKSVAVIWGVIFLVLHTLSLVNVTGLNPFDYTKLSKLVTSFVALIVLALVLIFIGLSLKMKKAGPVVGIILGAVYILNFDFENIFISVVNLITGICFIISCAGMLRYISKTNKSKNATQKSGNS